MLRVAYVLRGIGVVEAVEDGMVVEQEGPSVVAVAALVMYTHLLLQVVILVDVYLIALII